MRRFAFATTLLLLSILFLSLHLPPKKISSPEQLQQFQPNQKIIIQGQVIKETFSKKTKKGAMFFMKIVYGCVKDRLPEINEEIDEPGPKSLYE